MNLPKTCKTANFEDPLEVSDTKFLSEAAVHDPKVSKRRCIIEV